MDIFRNYTLYTDYIVASAGVFLPINFLFKNFLKNFVSSFCINWVTLAHHISCEHGELSYCIFQNLQCLVGNILGKLKRIV